MSANLLMEILEMNANPFIDHLIRERRSQRGFLEQPVPIGIVKDILSTASHAPSAGNAQPWRCHVLTGEARDRVSRAAVAALRTDRAGLMPEPAALLAPSQGAEPASADELERQFLFFGAPVGIIFTMDRRLGGGGLLCYGCFLQNLMLAAKARGLDTCAQQVWSLQHRVLRTELGLAHDQIVIAGMSMGWANNGVHDSRRAAPRRPLEHFASFAH